MLVRTKFMSFSTSSSVFLDFCFNVERLKIQLYRQGWILQFMGMRQTLRKVP